MNDDTKNRGWDAYLDHWMVIVVAPEDTDDRWFAIAGAVSMDRKRRWPDHRHIITSRLISEEDEIGAGAIVQTRNSRYLLGRPIGSTLN